MIFEDIGGASGGIYLEVNGSEGTGYAQGTGSLTGQMSTSFTYADHFEGSMGADQMFGSDFGSGPDQSNESWVGEAGDDTIDGGGGFDLVQYNLEFDGTLGVMVNLETGVATDRFGDTDSLINIEGAAGTEMADTLIGDAGDNFLDGRGGDDSIDGGAGDDFLIGGSGNDSIDAAEFGAGHTAARMHAHEAHDCTRPLRHCPGWRGNAIGRTGGRSSGRPPSATRRMPYSTPAPIMERTCCGRSRRYACPGTGSPPSGRR